MAPRIVEFNITCNPPLTPKGVAYVFDELKKHNVRYFELTYDPTVPWFRCIVEEGLDRTLAEFLKDLLGKIVTEETGDFDLGPVAGDIPVIGDKILQWRNHLLSLAKAEKGEDTLVGFEVFRFPPAFQNYRFKDTWSKLETCANIKVPRLLSRENDSEWTLNTFKGLTGCDISYNFRANIIFLGSNVQGCVEKAMAKLDRLLRHHYKRVHQSTHLILPPPSTNISLGYMLDIYRTDDLGLAEPTILQRPPSLAQEGYSALYFSSSVIAYKLRDSRTRVWKRPVQPLRNIVSIKGPIETTVGFKPFVGQYFAKKAPVKPIPATPAPATKISKTTTPTTIGPQVGNGVLNWIQKLDLTSSQQQAKISQSPAATTVTDPLDELHYCEAPQQRGESGLIDEAAKIMGQGEPVKKSSSGSDLLCLVTETSCHTRPASPLPKSSTVGDLLGQDTEAFHTALPEPLVPLPASDQKGIPAYPPPRLRTPSPPRQYFRTMNQHASAPSGSWGSNYSGQQEQGEKITSQTPHGRQSPASSQSGTPARGGWKGPNGRARQIRDSGHGSRAQAGRGVQQGRNTQRDDRGDQVSRGGYSGSNGPRSRGAQGSRGGRDSQVGQGSQGCASGGGSRGARGTQGAQGARSAENNQLRPGQPFRGSREKLQNTSHSSTFMRTAPEPTAAPLMRYEQLKGNWAYGNYHGLRGNGEARRHLPEEFEQSVTGIRVFNRALEDKLVAMVDKGLGQVGRVTLRMVFGRMLLFDVHDKARNWSDKEVSPAFDPTELLRQLAIFPDETVEFVPTLSTEGADANRLAEIPWGAETDSWKLEETKGFYDFYCFAHKNIGFILRVDAQSFEYAFEGLHDSPLDRLYIHCPDKAWDVQALLDTTDTAYFEAKFGEGARKFIDTIAVKEGVPATLPTFTFEQKPAEYGFTVTLARIRHTARYRDVPRRNTFLDIAMVQDTAPPKKERLPKGIEVIRVNRSTWEKESGLANLWYEASITTPRLENMFKQNVGMEYGEIAPWSGTDLKLEGALRNLYEPALGMIARMDEIGCKNNNYRSPFGSKSYEEEQEPVDNESLLW